MRIEVEVKLDFKDVLIRPKRSTLNSRSEVKLEREFIMKHSSKKLTGVPIFAANMDTTGTFEMAVALTSASGNKEKMYTAIHKFYSLEAWMEFATTHPECLPWVGITMGVSDDDTKFVQEVLAKIPQIDIIVIDVANGYTEIFVQKVKQMRTLYPDKIIIAGNVVTAEMTEELILSGADIVKVGIGPGSVCTTRIVTGVGYPQLSAIIECADAAHGLAGHIISDGGCSVPGDLAKAFGAGADFVMLGGMFAGHEESGGATVEDESGNKFKEFYGMSSEDAMKKYYKGVAEYRASEGKKVRVPYRGLVKDTLQYILGGLRSACTYVGASKLKELSKRTTFVRVTQQNNTVFGNNTK